MLPNLAAASKGMRHPIGGKRRSVITTAYIISKFIAAIQYLTAPAKSLKIS
jgi:hypothetical protein